LEGNRQVRGNSRPLYPPLPEAGRRDANGDSHDRAAPGIGHSIR